MQKTLLFISSIIFSVSISAKNKKAEAPLKSKEDVEFVSATESPFLDFAKSQDFVGYLNRINETSKDLSRVDVYIPPPTTEIAMTKKVCEKILTNIFGPLKEGSLKYKGATLFNGHTGKTCAAQFDDLDKEALYPERYVVAGYIRTKPVAIVFRLSKKSTDTDTQNIKAFWSSLR